jgi:ubiquinone biosynthesis protein COQ9
MNNEKSSQAEYLTKDIYVASTLIASGLFNLLDIRKKEKQFTFVFLFDPMIETFVAKYWNDELEVKAHKLFTSFKDLKNRMYNQN